MSSNPDATPRLAANIPSVELWPDVLVGPMLRRLTPSTVSVFIALKVPATVTLHVFGPVQEVDDFTSDPTATRALGLNLHAAVITLDLPVGRLFKPNERYSYDLELHLTEAGVTKSVATELQPTAPKTGELPQICYSQHHGEYRPAFYAPPAQATTLVDEDGAVVSAGLRIVHASCRLPHGDTPDALPGLDGFLSKRALDPNAYPHHLIFHGDQIYADDVAPCMLYMAQQVGQQALGWAVPEVVPSYFGDLIARFPELRMGARGALLRADGCITSNLDLCGCHLITLAEFIGMYLLVWSPALWPTAEVDQVRVIAVPGAEDALPTEDWGTPTVRTYKRYDKSFTVSSDRDSTIALYEKSVPRVVGFGSGLENVRRALANVSVLMCFDDHEVTDDWMLHREWQERLSASTLAQRIVSNSLAAYAIFQHWGNEPDQFSGGSGAEVLDGIVQWSHQMIHGPHGTVEANVPEFPEIAPETIVVMQEPGPPSNVIKGVGMSRLVGLLDYDAESQPPTEPAPPEPIEAPTEPIKWDYRVQCGAYEFAFLDTRTHRDYPPEPKGPPALLRPTAYSQIPAALESVVTIIVSPAPFLGHWLVERVVQPIVRDATDSAVADFEAFAFDRVAFLSVADLLAPYGHMAFVLSGDVHYSACIVGVTSAPPGESSIIQFISSPLCNDMWKPTVLSETSSLSDASGDELLVVLAQTLSDQAASAGWPTLGRVLHAAVEVVGDYTAFQVRNFRAVARAAANAAGLLLGLDDVWLLSLITDRRSYADRLRGAKYSALLPGGVLLHSQVAHATYVSDAGDSKLARGSLDLSRTVVASGAFCEVCFEAGKVVHRVHFDPVATAWPSNPLPYTVVEIGLDV